LKSLANAYVEFAVLWSICYNRKEFFIIKLKEAVKFDKKK